MTEYKELDFKDTGKISDTLAGHILGLMGAYFEGYPIFAVCIKEPRGNLDTGRHYYALYYYSPILKKNVKFWYDFYNKYDIDYLNLKKTRNGYEFGSGVIGDSRLRCSFSGLANLLSKLFGSVFGEHTSRFDNFIKLL